MARTKQHGALGWIIGDYHEHAHVRECGSALLPDRSGKADEIAGAKPATEESDVELSYSIKVSDMTFIQLARAERTPSDSEGLTAETGMLAASLRQVELERMIGNSRGSFLTLSHAFQSKMTRHSVEGFWIVVILKLYPISPDLPVTVFAAQGWMRLILPLLCHFAFDRLTALARQRQGHVLPWAIPDVHLRIHQVFLKGKTTQPNGPRR